MCLLDRSPRCWKALVAQDWMGWVHPRDRDFFHEPLLRLLFDGKNLDLPVPVFGVRHGVPPFWRPLGIGPDYPVESEWKTAVPRGGGEPLFRSGCWSPHRNHSDFRRNARSVPVRLLFRRHRRNVRCTNGAGFLVTLRGDGTVITAGTESADIVTDLVGRRSPLSIVLAGHSMVHSKAVAASIRPSSHGEFVV